MKRFFALLWLSLLPIAALALNPPTPKTSVAVQSVGVPMVRHYPRSQTQTDATIVTVAMDRVQDMFFSTRDGVLRFSGGAFELIDGSEHILSSSMDACDDGALAVGGINDFGEFRRSESGVYQWHSFAQGQFNSIGQVWSTVCRGKVRYFLTRRKVFRVEDGALQVLDTPKPMTFMTETKDNVIFIAEKGKFYLQGPAGNLVPAPEFPGLEKGLATVGARANDLVMFYLGADGVYLNSPTQWKKLENEALREVAAQHAYVAKSPDGESLVVGTLSGEVWWLNADFSAKFRVDLKAGGVLDLSFDHEGTVWVACERGIYSIAWPSNWTHFSSEQGVTGNAQALLRTEQGLFLGASTGLFKLGPDQRFVNYGIENEQVLHLANTAAGPMVLYGSSVHYIHPHQRVPVFDDWLVNDLVVPKTRPLSLVVLTDDEVILLDYQQGQWQQKSKANHPTAVGVFELSADRYMILSDAPAVIQFDPEHKIVSQQAIAAESLLRNATYFELGNVLYASSLQKLMRFDLAHQKFVAATALEKQLPGRDEWIDAYESKSGHQWLLGRRSIVMRGGPEQNFEAVPLPEAGLRFECMVPDEFSIFFCDTLSLLRLRPIGQQPALDAKATRLDRVEIDGKAVALEGETPVLKAMQSLTIKFTSNTHVQPVLYRWRLARANAAMGPWSDYDHKSSWQIDELTPGDYIFEAQAKPALFGEAKPAALAFKIEGQWWQSQLGRGLAIALALLALTSLAFLIVAWRARRLEQNTRSLTLAVEDRTRTLSEQAVALERANRKLEDMALRDGLTEVANRRQFDQRIQRLFDERRRFTLILLDLDHFKRYNDHFGHLAGDDLLKRAAEIFSQSLTRAQPDALLARFGGEEFAALLPEARIDATVEIAEELRSELVRQFMETSVTVSAGVAQVKADDTVESLVQRADTALYRAKANGRNRVERES
jgi:diguanylate cyclase (GGDEF)-like protein